jgi:hypothetical protein
MKCDRKINMTSGSAPSSGTPQTFFDVGRQAWAHGPSGEPPKVTGLDVMVECHGRLVALHAFVDTPVA